MPLGWDSHDLHRIPLLRRSPFSVHAFDIALGPHCMKPGGSIVGAKGDMDVSEDLLTRAVLDPSRREERLAPDVIVFDQFKQLD